MKTMKVMTATAPTMNAMTKNGDNDPVRLNSKSCAIAEGTRATIPEKMMSEMPLPTPRAVICSPSHIKNTVPPVKRDHRRQSEE